MKYIWKIAGCLVLAGIVHACASTDTHLPSGQGRMSLDVSVDATFRTWQGQIVNVDPTPSVSADSLHVTLSDASGASAQWPSPSIFNNDPQTFDAGSYTFRLIGREASQGIRFEGSATAGLTGGDVLTVPVTVTPADAMVRVHSATANTAWRLHSVSASTAAEGYFNIYGPDTTLYLTPDFVGFYATLSDNAGRTRNVSIPGAMTCKRATLSQADITLDNRSLILHTDSPDGTDKRLDLPANLFDLAEPSISAEGFEPDVPIVVIEGFPPNDDVLMTAHSAMPLKHLYLSMQSPMIAEFGDVPQAVDLLNLTPDEAQLLQSVNLHVATSDDGLSATLHFNDVIERMANVSTALSVFNLLAVDCAGLCSRPMHLAVDTRMLSLEIKSVSTAVLGIDVATLEILADEEYTEESDFVVFAADADGRYTVPCPVVGWSSEGKTIRMSVRVPEGMQPVPLSIHYMGLPRLQVHVQRVNPHLALKVDPHATWALIEVEATENPGGDADAIVAYAVRNARILANGAEATVSVRNAAEGTLTVIGFDPSTKYTLELGLLPGTACTAATITTEAAIPLPSTDWSDWENVINYSHLPSGGRYSSTGVAIVDRQNFRDVSAEWPKKSWASVNAKTFSTKATTHNTWYMQPSSWLETTPQGTRTVCLTSVGWDHNGPAIADDINNSGVPRLYSAVVPPVAHRSAGRMWLGKYSYDNGQDVLVDGVAFVARPAALNGYFKFIPDKTQPTDRGYVSVQLYRTDDFGNEITVADGRTEFGPRPDFTAFTVIFNYRMTFVKPTHMRVMFVSSTAAPPVPNQNVEDTTVPVSADLPAAAYTGSRLWLNNLTLSY